MGGELVQSDAEITAADIARLAGVGRAAVSNWRKRFSDFPEPVGGTAASPAFRLADVEDWLRANNRLPAETPLAALWSAIQHAGAATGSVEQIVRALAERISARDRPRPRAGRRAANQPSARGSLPDGLAEAVDTAVEAAGASQVIEFLLERYLDQQGRRATYMTAPLVADLMVRLVPVDGATVLDPACGAGELLRAAAARGARRLLGQDPQEDLVALAGARLGTVGTDHDLRVGSLVADAFVDGRADVVVCEPPFAQRVWGHDELAFDSRWEYELPPRSESELAWVQHALARLRPGGQAVVLLPPAVASRPAGRRVRNALLRRGALRAVVALPPGAGAPAHLPLHLWLLCRPERPAAPRDVLLLDASAQPWPAAAEMIAEVVSGYQASGEVGGAGAALARAVPLIDLVGDEIDVTPARHVAPEPPSVNFDIVARQRDALAELLADLPALLPQLSDQAPTSPPQRTVTVAELIRDGHLQQHSPQDNPPRSGDVLVQTVGPQPRAVVVAEGFDRQLEGPCVLLRPNPDVLDAWFVAGFIAQAANVRLVGSLGSARLDLRRARLPRLPLERQREYGAWFERLDRFDRAVRSASSLSAEVTRLIAEGLASGTIRSESSTKV